MDKELINEVVYVAKELLDKNPNLKYGQAIQMAKEEILHESYR